MLSSERSLPAGPRRPGAAAGEAGSGTAIGVAMIFPMLMLVIVALSGLTRSSRTEQVLQVAADRAALTASACCLHTGGTHGAEQIAKINLAAASRLWRNSDVACSNDVFADSRVLFADVSGNPVDIRADVKVPPGGSARVLVTCRMPPSVLGGTGLPGIDVTRRAVGLARVDPYRQRFEPLPSP